MHPRIILVISTLVLFQAGMALAAAPDPPENITIVFKSSRSVNISWSDGNNDTLDFMLDIREGYARLTDTMNVSVSGAYIDKLHPFTKYYIHIRARNSDGLGNKSFPFNFTTDEEAPSVPPANVTFHSISSNGILVQWGDVPQVHQNGVIRGYKVKYVELPNGNGQETRVNDTAHKEQMVVGLNEFTTYNICVLAFTAKGDGPMSCKSVSTAEDRPHSSPVNLRAHNISSTSIWLQWGEVPPADQNGLVRGYRVKYRPSTGGNESIKTVNVTGSKWMRLVGLNVYTRYNICVLAFTAKGEGPRSCKTVTTAEDRPEKAPDDIHVYNASYSSILVQWGDVPEADRNGVIQGYRVLYRALNSVNGTMVTVNGSQQKNYTLEGLKEFTVYNICVIAFTAKGEGPPSCTSARTNAEGRPQKAPNNVGVHNTSSTSIWLQWGDVPKEYKNGVIQGYRVIYDALTGGNELSKTVTGTGSKRMRLVGLNVYTRYNVCVLAFTVKGEGPRSCQTVTTAEDRPRKPPDNVRTNITDNSTNILIKWDDVPEADRNGVIEGYRVFYKILNSVDETMVTLNGSQTKNHTLEGLDEDAKYNICVLAFTAAGNGPMSCKLAMIREARPSKPPENVRARNTSSRSIRVEWEEVPESYQNGIIGGYRIKYWALPSGNESEITVDDAETKNKSLELLNEYTKYNICVLAYTGKGDGPASCVSVRTAQDRPAGAPRNVTAETDGLTSILVKWVEVKQEDQNGIIEGYRVMYKKRFENAERNVTSVDVSVRQLLLEELIHSTSYNICVVAFTSIGEGPPGCINGTTIILESQLNKTCHADQSVAILCNTSSNETKLGWLYEARDIKGDNSTRKLPQSLLLHKVTDEDEGLYTCQVNRTEQQEFKSMRLLVAAKLLKLSEDDPKGIDWVIVGPVTAVGLLLAAAALGLLLWRRHQIAKKKAHPPEAPLAPAAPARKRRPSDPWELLEDDVFVQGFLGVGAFGEVYRAVVQHVGGIKGNRECAVKKLRGCVSSDNRKKFLKEMELMKMLSETKHPNIIRFLGCVTRSEPMMIVMEYTPFGDLLGFMRKSRGVEDKHATGEELHVRELTNYDLVKFAQQIACGMAYLKSKGVMHRDLAARNVLMSNKFTCKITDFGMAFQPERYGYGSAKRGRIPIKWTAPEVLFETSSYQVSSKSDVWSYGIVLYEIFTLGGTPYDGFREADVMAQLQNKQYRMPRPEHVSESIYEIMMHCWSEDPDERPTFDELNTIFLDCMAGQYYMQVVDMEKYQSVLYQPEKFVSDDDEEDDDDLVVIQLQEPPEGPIISETSSESEAEPDTELPEGRGADPEIGTPPPEEPRYVSDKDLPIVKTKPSSDENGTRM